LSLKLEEYTGTVRRLTSTIAVFVMVLMMLPVLACSATSNMSRTERDCCEQMQGKCGDMVRQGCCQVDVHTDLTQLPSQTTIAPVLPVALVAIIYPRVIELPLTRGYRWRVPDEHSPPGLLIASSTVLRI
jgi:hypothetical protein